MKKRGPEPLMWKLQFYVTRQARKRKKRKTPRWVYCDTGWCTWKTILQYGVYSEVPRDFYRYVSNTGIRCPFLGERDQIKQP